MKAAKIILLIVSVFFTNILYAVTERTIKVYNNTDETLEIVNPLNISQVVAPNSTLEVIQYINRPTSLEECQNFTRSHTYNVTAKLLDSGATFELTYKIGCLRRIYFAGPGSPPIKIYFVGYLDPMIPPICKSHCDSVSTSYAMEHSGGSDNPYYSTLIFKVQK